jgi:hypothetical protein
MELTELKRIQNTGKIDDQDLSKSEEQNLPGFVNGLPITTATDIKPNIFKSAGIILGDIGKGIGNAAKATGEFLEGNNKLFGTNGAAIATGAMGAIDMVGQIGAASKFNRTADDLLRDAGTS